MRSVGLGLAFAATTQFVLVSTPAFAQPPASPPAAPETTTTTTTTTTTPAATATATPAATTPVAKSGTVTVHIQSTRPVTLERRAPGRDLWESACSSPCDKALASTDEYRIAGDGMKNSKVFFLDPAVGEKVTLDVRPGTDSKYTTGTWVLVAGAVLAVGGIVVIAAGSGSNSGDVPGDNGTTTNNKNMNFIWTGSALILTGVVLGLTGGSIMVANAGTRVDGPVESKSDKRNDDTIGVKAEVTATRTPTWHEERGPVLSPSTTMFPIIHTTF